MIDSAIEKFVNFTLPLMFNGEECVLHLPLKIPLNETIKEYTQRVMQNFHISYYVFDELYSSLENFIQAETMKYFDEVAEQHIGQFKAGEFQADEMVRCWEKLFKSETLQFSEPIGTTDEEHFSMVYHKLVHSAALESILNEEHAYAAIALVSDADRKRQISELTERHNNEMADAIKDLHTKVTEKDINDLVAKLHEEHSLAAGRLNREVEALHETQRKQYRRWLMTILEEQSLCSTPLNSPANVKIPNTKVFSINSDSQTWPSFEESFTIHLGSQMKQMHNVRILSADILDFCRIKCQTNNLIEVEPQRLETALALYSNSMSGIVLLTEVGPIDGFSNLSTDFANVCQQTAEFHFSTFEKQLQNIKTLISEANLWRSRKTREQTDIHQAAKRSISSRHLKAGDIFITKHSNLSQVHIVFHVMVDDTVKSSEINSRHPVILGLRNVLKIAASYDVTTITLPLLLTHEMTEDITVAWCSKRAELIFKCVKGFMIEAAGAGGAELHNLQFLVPTGISLEVFSALSNMLPSIFRVSNPLVLKTSTCEQSNAYSNNRK